MFGSRPQPRHMLRIHRTCRHPPLRQLPNLPHCVERLVFRRIRHQAADVRHRNHVRPARAWVGLGSGARPTSRRLPKATLSSPNHSRALVLLDNVIQLNYNRSSILNLRGKSMAATALVQTRIDPAVRDRAAEVLGKMGMTVSDVVRILLTRVANEGALPAGLTVDPAAHDAWFRAKVIEALDDPRPAGPHDKVESHFAQRRAAVLRRASEGDA